MQFLAGLIDLNHLISVSDLNHDWNQAIKIMI